MISSLSRGESGTISLLFWEVVPRKISEKGVVAENEETSILDEELSTSMIFFNERTLALSTLLAPRSGMSCCNSVTFSRGGLYGRFVSVPMMRCAASRCDRAEITCGALKAGFRGTFFCQYVLLSPQVAHLTSIAPSLNSAYVITANSQLLPKLTATLSPFCTPLSLSPSAAALLLSSNSL